MRTDCNKPILQFTPLARRLVTARFDAGAISSDGGVLLLREVDRRIRLLDRVDSMIRDPRNPLLVEHQQRTLLAQRVLAIACGWEDLNDHGQLRRDLIFQLATDRKASGRKPGQGDVDPDRPLASASTLCRLENRVDRQACVEMNKLLVELYIESHPTPPKEVILDFDATDDPVHGKQEGRFFHGYYDHYCFLPLYVFAGEQLLCAYLRPSNIDESKHAWAILALIVKRLRQAWPQVKIIFRGDSGFCRWKMLRWCDRQGVDFIVGLARNSRLVERSKPLMEQAKQQFEQSGQKQRLFAELNCAAYTRDRERRVIARIEHGDKGENPRYIVVSEGLSGAPQNLYDDVYCARGEMEKRLVALHHLDAPWKPAEVEQRDGRILRQGNENKDVSIYRYVTEGSFDAYMWQALETKARFISQVITGDNAARRAEDIGGQELSYAEVKAIASGNPAVLTLAEADAELQRLSVLKKNHLDEQFVARRRVRNLPESIASMSEHLSSLSSDEATAKKHATDPIAIDGRAYPREDIPNILGGKLDNLPKHVSETTRVPLGTYRGLTFGMVLRPQFPPDVYLEGSAMRQSMFARQYPGPRAVLNELERLANSYGPACDQVRQNLAIAEGQLRDYQARLGKPFVHEAYLSELTSLRDELKSGLSGARQKEGKEAGRTIPELSVRIKSIKAAHTVAVAPERVRQKHSSAEEPITARIRRRAESLPVSDRTTETDAGTATTPASHPVESVGRATAGDQSPVILADHASPTIDCSIRDEVSFQERVARSRREGNDYLATDIFERGMARSSGNDSQR